MTALDRANAEDALLPIPKLVESDERIKTQKHLAVNPDEVMADLVKGWSQSKAEESQGTLNHWYNVALLYLFAVIAHCSN